MLESCRLTRRLAAKWSLMRQGHWSAAVMWKGWLCDEIDCSVADQAGQYCKAEKADGVVAAGDKCACKARGVWHWTLTLSDPASTTDVQFQKAVARVGKMGEMSSSL